MEKKNQQHVFIIGCKGIPARYGGFETFVDKLVQYQKAPQLQYHVACAAEREDYHRETAVFSYHGASCVAFPWRRLGSARAITYDLDALRYFIRYAKKNQIPHPVFYILACRIGPFISHYKQQIEAIGGVLYVNPDGHEFLRAKWSPPVRMYWKFSERLMVRHANLLICDSRTIEDYICTEYKGVDLRTAFIAYGAETEPSPLADQDARLLEWYAKWNIEPGGYYLAVGRFVPENNYETMLREFMKSSSKKKFVLITPVTEDFLQKLQQQTGFEKDGRICFAGTVYDQELLKKIRENAYASFHGHEVGGTNPSLLEALASTKLNLLLDVGFNREVAKDAAFYWTKEEGNLAYLIEQAEKLADIQIAEMGRKALERIRTKYSWEYIAGQYEQLFLTNLKEEETNMV